MISDYELDKIAQKHRKDPEALLKDIMAISKRGGDALYSDKSVSAVDRSAALLRACESLDVRVLRWMLSMGMNIESKAKGEPAAYGAFRSGDIEKSRVVIDAGFSLFRGNEENALAAAVASHNPEVVRLVLDSMKKTDLAKIAEYSLANAFFTIEDVNVKDSVVSMEVLRVLVDAGYQVGSAWLSALVSGFEQRFDHRSRLKSDVVSAAMKIKAQLLSDAMHFIADRIGSPSEVVMALTGKGVLLRVLCYGLDDDVKWLCSHGMPVYDTNTSGTVWLMDAASTLATNDFRDDNGRKESLLKAVGSAHQVGININLRGNDGDGVLGHMVRRVCAHYSENGKEYCNWSEIRQVLSLGFDLNIKDRNGLTPFQYAVSHGCLPMATLLFEAGADAGRRFMDGGTALHAYVHWTGLQARNRAGFGEVEPKDFVGFLIKRAGLGVDAVDHSGRTALHLSYMADEGQPVGVEDLTQALLEHRASPNVLCGALGWTPLQYHARMLRTTETVKNMIDAGGDVFAIDESGVSLAEQSRLGILGYNMVNVVRCEVIGRTGEQQEIPNGVGMRPLHVAHRDNDEWSARRALSRINDINALSGEGYAALHYAVLGGNADLAELLLDHGADVNVSGRDGVRALHLAVNKAANANADAEVTELLVKRGADVAARWNNKTASSMTRDAEIGKVLRSVVTEKDVQGAIDSSLALDVEGEIVGKPRSSGSHDML